MSDKPYAPGSSTTQKKTPQINRLKKKTIHWINHQTPKEVLVKAAHLIKTLTRFVLQLCAVLSQLNEHEKALDYSKKAAMYAKDLSYLTLVLI